jgi:FKBP-type peptidyl-prolyl cis-trans isomerase FklB
MKKSVFLLALMTAPLWAEEVSTPMTDQQKMSYTLGWQVGQNVKSQGLTLDMQVFSEAVKESLSGAKERLTPEESRAAMQMLQKVAADHQRAQAEKNKADGDAFLAANKKKSGVKTTSSGLQYKVVKKGAGTAPTADDKVSVHYRGTLLDGTEFDSSYKRGQPAVFPLGGVIKGWTEGLQLMKPGAKYIFYVPSDLAYGAAGSRSSIPPNAVLTFEVELLSVEK